MKSSYSALLIRLASITALLLIMVAGAGFFWQGSGQPVPFTTVWGQDITLSGQGLYQRDSTFAVPIMRGTDAFFLLVTAPLLAVSIYFYRRGSLRWQLMLSGVLAFVLYYAISVSFGVAYNVLFLLYVLFFSFSLFSFILSMTAIRLDRLAPQLSPRLPYQRTGIFLIVTGALLTLIWLLDIIPPLLAGTAPVPLGAYTTVPTYVIDLGLISPLAIATGALLVQRKPLGVLLSVPVLVCESLIGLVVACQTIMQKLAGVNLSAGQMFAFVFSFILMSLISFSFLFFLLRSVEEPD